MELSVDHMLRITDAPLNLFCLTQNWYEFLTMIGMHSVPTPRYFQNWIIILHSSLRCKDS